MKFKMLALAPPSVLAIGASAPAAAQPKYGTWGYDATAMDSGMKPGDDFFAYVNGSCSKRTEIAPDRTYVGIDSVLNDQIDKDVRAVVEDMAKSPDQSGRIGQQVGDFYASWMDEAGIEARGLAPAEPYLKQIADANSRGELID